MSEENNQEEVKLALAEFIEETLEDIYGEHNARKVLEKESVKAEVQAVELLSETNFKPSQIIATDLALNTLSEILLEGSTLGGEEIVTTGVLDNSTSFQAPVVASSPLYNDAPIFIEEVISQPPPPYDFSGDDVFDGVATDGHFVGGLGNDTINYENSTQRVSLKLSQGRGFVNDSEFDTYDSIENIIGTDHHQDGLEGSNGDNIIWGRGGQDFIWALAGDDVLYGELGNDAIQGHDGDDHLYGGEGFDTLTGGNGADTFYVDHDDWASFTYYETVKDFDLTEGDAIDISDILDNFGQSGFSSNIDDYLEIIQINNDSYIRVDANGGGNHDAVMVIENVTGITDHNALIAAGDIIL